MSAEPPNEAADDAGVVGVLCEAALKVAGLPIPLPALAVTPFAVVALEFAAAFAGLLFGSEAAATEDAPDPAPTVSLASPSKTKTTEPSFTLSPNLTRNSFTTPACEEGISIDALSDSTVISDCSALMASPALTNNSITATSSKSPISGTFISIIAICFSIYFDDASRSRLTLGRIICFALSLRARRDGSRSRFVRGRR